MENLVAARYHTESYRRQKSQPERQAPIPAINYLRPPPPHILTRLKVDRPPTLLLDNHPATFRSRRRAGAASVSGDHNGMMLRVIPPRRRTLQPAAAPPASASTL
ncbi:hypothetical protein LZ554_003689 [Drepanopeziza brunnea f. sp. 'monogermtubi']|nr:hypothetical protein LZ554_003689 [Drepanopeziza brunnea f. sp. 'monogermtubi']